MRFRVNGQPAPQGSKRHVGGGRMVEMSKAVGPWREAVRAEAQRVDPASRWHGPSTSLMVTIVFVLPRPKTHYSAAKMTGADRLTPVRPSAPRYPAKRPDLDKLCRAVLDGLVAGGVMADDAQVVSLSASKVWAAAKDAPGAIIEVEAL